MSDKFSLYQTDGLWGIIENASNEKQTSIKSYFGSDLIIKRLNEQDQQIDQLKQQLAEKDEQINNLEQMCQICNKEQENELLKQQLAEKDQRIAELEKDLEFTTKTANELIEIKHKLEQELDSKNMLCENYNCGLNKKIKQLQQELAELKEKYNKANEKLKNITEEVENNFVHGQDYEKLKQELAELKEKAITTHFKLGQEIWFVGYSSIQSWIIKGIELKYIKDRLCEICRLGHHGTDDYSCCVMPFDSDRCFATEQEAIEKLKEIQGNE